ncbi:hypothetical protein RHSIM_Rhsim08G0176800 [Rhododendron simsii]|uniref:Transmembrane protein n=1 Tax=Rhododendron simsii TaxID=118357 RepID=A0A834GLY5_RHOSS|nr:hypothetical protein RHSIM_Rhsim08G0176800 [Rhododendron simsii]
MWQSPLKNDGGETPSPRPRIQQNTPPLHHFHSTVSVQKLRRFNTLILVFRFAAFYSSTATSVFMLVNPRGPDSPWYDFDAIRASKFAIGSEEKAKGK